MNILLCSINTLKRLYEISFVKVGQHLYWQLRVFQVHAQVLMTFWVVIAILLVSAILVVRNPQTILTFGHNFFKYVLEFIRDVSKTQIGEEYGPWVLFVGTMFLFIFVSNWLGTLLPWKIIQLPHGELAAPTKDINTTVALALLTSVAYFYAGLLKKELAYFGKYIQPTSSLLPINILENFTKLVSLSFRLFKNILANELAVVVLASLVPLVVPIPVMLLGLFTSSIQALIFATLAAAYVGKFIEGASILVYIFSILFIALHLTILKEAIMFISTERSCGRDSSTFPSRYDMVVMVSGGSVIATFISMSSCMRLQQVRYLFMSVSGTTFDISRLQLQIEAYESEYVY
ncbi:ATP synthase subunit a, chloroplastic-like [Arachis stenosperma]|uniref:ATP synthase subunit a, chloroplastic-like n=1 Tax=Arachis stenosperma TaxID=217475 RepID=UPI0025AC8CC0|nr:ATP synthase subunit a, chloroplastic-like [Arachis stenosperma]